MKNNKLIIAREEKCEIIKRNFREEIKQQVEINNSYQKDQFMENISENPSLLENFSTDRLIRIIKYWDDRVKKEEQILTNMKKTHKN